ncbi:NAD(P)H-hydrate dehydratase [Robiginitomaculum antarcticum]|uniref:NAD(P)H-hydrate dehydratase n=1 Tax=Robiginitomaculum antarcticum TaxID=437507 RepID=UPI0003A8343C|nr:NAD(P)H-hydrate dehydratase [Robiginitomaculum antarcticum]
MPNGPDIFKHALPHAADDAHKYDNGHLAIFAAPDLTGATRLSAQAALRIGAGLVSVLAMSRGDVYRASLPPDIMVTQDALGGLNKVSAVLAGPGGIAPAHHAALDDLPGDMPRVIDSSAFPAPAGEAQFPPCTVLTSHDGEFARMFPDMKGSREDMARRAAAYCGAIIVLKGPVTYIAHPDGRCVINNHPDAALAKGGTGDVLAGFIAGLMAQHMAAFEAACAGVWTHSECGARLGRGLIASDLPGEVPAVLKGFFGD